MSIFNKLAKNSTRKILKSMEGNENYSFVCGNHLFGKLSSEAYVYLLDRIIERRYCKGEMVFKQENPGVCLFIVKQGKISIDFHDPDGEQYDYIVLREGGLFGEMSIITTADRTATAKAIENDTILLALSSFDFEELNSQFPRDGLKILKAVTTTIIDNLVETTKRYHQVRYEVKQLKKRLDK